LDESSKGDVRSGHEGVTVAAFNMTTSSEQIELSDDELSASSIDEAWGADEAEIEEGDILELGPYSGWESDHRTLVGLAPPTRPSGRKPPRRPRTPQAPSAQLMPQSEPPGPFIADDDEIPRSFRTKKLGIWTVAMPALLVAAAAVVLVLRGLGSGPERPGSHAAVAQVVPQENAGLIVKLTGVDAHVYLDGRDQGVPPVLVTGLAPGSHALKISGRAYAPFEQPVLLVADHVSTVEPKLTPLAPSGPAAEVTVDAKEVIVAAKEEPASEAALTKAHAAKALVPAAPAAPVAAVPAPVSTGAPPEVTVISPYKGALNISSVPPVNVVVDGRPLGRSPRVVEVAPGAHTVVFVHPTLGRQSVSVSVGAGESVKASADF
jgi:hypothetical protein